MKKKLVWLSLSFLLLAARPTHAGRMLVTYWEKWTGEEKAAMQAVVDDFNASQNRLCAHKRVEPLL